MREKNKKRVRALILSVSFLSLTAGGIYWGIYYNSLKKQLNEKNIQYVSNITTKIELQDDKVEEQKTVQDKIENNEDKILNSSSNIDSSSYNNSQIPTNKASTDKKENKSKAKNNSGSSKNNSVLDDNNVKKNNTNENVDVIPKDNKNEENKEDLTKVANPNDFFYSITGGKTEFKTSSSCLKAGEDIAFIDVVDVHYYRCYEVMSKANTIMGYYLNIFCESGNCNRYKTMINMSDY